MKLIEERLRKLMQLQQFKRFVLTLISVSMLTVLLGGCLTTGTIETNKIATVCSPWDPLYYSAKGDTKATIKGIEVHNEIGRELHCWK